MKNYLKNIKEFEALMTSDFIQTLIHRSYKKRDKKNIPIALSILIKKNKKEIENA